LVSNLQREREKERERNYEKPQEFCPLGYSTVESVGNQPKFRRNMSASSSSSKNKPSKKTA
jgi:hypothetical protein